MCLHFVPAAIDSNGDTTSSSLYDSEDAPCDGWWKATFDAAAAFDHVRAWLLLICGNVPVAAKQR